MVQNIVTQFDDPLAFYRELIQNSLDAKSNRIDVTIQHRPGESGKGEVVIAVEDDGEGMNEHIIDTYLLVLFRSSKEDDFTKIGKFGIGFLSVFAIKPTIVRVYTARGGESWRIDFHGCSRYDKFRLDQPRDGTRVELIRPMSAAKYPALVKKSLETVRHWCKYAESGIFFRDINATDPPTAITESFDLPGGASLRYTEEGTEIVMGFSSEEQPFYGFYNRGLTLKEGNKAFFPGVTYLAKSRYLEHTLTRDNVMEDDNYKKLMAILERLVRQEMPKKLKTELSDLAAQTSEAGRSGNNQAMPTLSDSWNRRVTFLWGEAQRSKAWFSVGKIRSWPIFPTLSGKPASRDDLQAATFPPGPNGARIIYHDAAPNRIVEKLGRKKCPVLVSGPWVDWIAALLGAEPRLSSATFMLPEIRAGKSLDPSERAFCATLVEMDREANRKYVQILPAAFDYPGSCIADFIFVTQKERELGGLTIARRDQDSFFDLVLSSMFTREKRSALVNLSHPFIRRLVKIHETRPGLAGYLCLKVMRLHDGRIPADKKRAYSNLAEQFETALLESALQRDVQQKAVHV